ncbi:uncharacterized protein LOC142333685 [Lycorma delicatula]|uniref:uncharacterized protein LOC142333685 n=1 Tax=Lycorma delicatula TaxID=130591 RepID=UPI003F510B6F
MDFINIFASVDYKLSFVLILTYFVSFNKADELDLPEYYWYYSQLRLMILSELKDNRNLHHTKISCLKCVYAAIRQQVKVVYLLIRQDSKKTMSDEAINETKQSCKSIRLFVEKDFQNWISKCKHNGSVKTNRTYDWHAPNTFSLSDDTDYNVLFEKCAGNYIIIKP